MKKVINIFKFLILVLFTFLIVFLPSIFAFSYSFFSELNYNMIYKKFNFFVLFIIFIILLKNFLFIFLNSKFEISNIKIFFQKYLSSVKYRWLSFIIFIIFDIIVTLINGFIISANLFSYTLLFLYYAFTPAYLLFLLFSSKNKLHIIEKTFCLVSIILFNFVILLFVFISWAFMGFDP